MFRLIHLFKRALQNLAAAPFENLVTVAVMAISLIILGLFYLFLLNASLFMEKWQSDVEIILYLADGTADAERMDLIDRIWGHPEINGVRYVSKEEAKQEFLRDLPEYSDLFDHLEKNPLPASLELGIRGPHRNPETIEAIALALGKEEIVKEAYFGQEWLSRLAGLIRFTSIVGATVGIFLLVSAVFIVSNTIMLTLVARKREIEIMRLVGASNLFVGMPFLMEGLLQGLFGGLVSLAALAGIHRLVAGALGNEISLILGTLNVSFLSPQMAFGLLLGGMTLGMFGSAISLVRYMKG